MMDGFLEQFVAGCEEHLGVMPVDSELIREAELLAGRVQKRLDSLRTRRVLTDDERSLPAIPSPETEVDPPIPESIDEPLDPTGEE